MSASVIRRCAVLLAVGAVAVVTFWTVIHPYFFDAPPGDYETRQGDILLTDRAWDAALERFDAALAVSPEHRGAWMGKAIALLQAGRTADAEAAFTHVIDRLGPTLAADDATGRAVLAGAYANRGILHDRDGRFAAALADYRRALAIDAGAVDGPGLMDRILFGVAQPSTVAKRAAYIERQLSLPEEQRVLRVPELDARQRMHKP
jgi:tetratricopeptide (TPR) repeat protein